MNSTAVLALERFNLYRELSKSGIVALVLISVLAGYLAGHPSELPLDLGHLGVTLLGVLFLASGSSAWNQLQEVATDSKMKRTAGRPIPSGRISREGARIFVAFSIAAGLTLLTALGPWIAVLGIAAIAFYNGFYTLWWKRKWSHAAVPGAIPGALPILMGYAAARGTPFTPAGIYLFAVLFFWQMPHFWVLAIKYKDDYAKGDIPTLPVTHGTVPTVNQIVVWCLAYVGIALVAPLFLGVGVFYLAVALAISVKILWELRAFAANPESKAWLRFFLWVNFSLMIYLGAAVLDLWRLHLLTPYLTR